MTDNGTPYRAGKSPAVFVGFDSAWGNKASGAICSVAFEDGEFLDFRPPRLVNFAAAADFVEGLRAADRPTIVAIDQPTVVPNATGMRPVDRASASVIGWMGGGVQPANTGKKALFGIEAPVWRFLEMSGPAHDPEAARTATLGVHVVEAFPALALASFDDAFFGQGKGPRYNPTKKTFKLVDWNAVIAAAKTEAAIFGLDDISTWLEAAMPMEKLRKEHQDLLDSVICLLVGARWRLRARAESIMIGDGLAGYMIAPASAAVRERLAKAADRAAVAVDGLAQEGGLRKLA